MLPHSMGEVVDLEAVATLYEQDVWITGGDDLLYLEEHGSLVFRRVKAEGIIWRWREVFLTLTVPVRRAEGDLERAQRVTPPGEDVLTGLDPQV